MRRRMLEYLLYVLAGVAVVGVVGWGTLDARRPEAAVAIESTPTRASAWLDGNFVGTTPLELGHIRPGTYVLRLQKYGHEDLIREVTLDVGLHTQRFDLAKLAGGSLEVTSNPDGARIFVDGETRGLTPLTLRSLMPGPHQIRLRRVNYLDWTGTVNIEPNRTVRRRGVLKSRMEAGYLADIKKDPKDVIAWADLAHYYILRDEWGKATDAFKNALVIIVEHPGSTHYSGRLQQEVQKVWGMQFKYSNQRRGQGVIVDAYVRAVKACPTYQRYYGQAVQYAMQINMDKAAREVIEAGILQFPHSQTWALATLSRWRRRNDDNDRLLRQLNSRVKKNPKDFVSRFQRAVVLRQQGKTEQAIEDYTAIVPLTDNKRVQSRLLLELGRFYERVRKYDEAADAYRRADAAETIPKDRAPIHYNIARVMTKLKRDDDTLKAWEQAVGFQENIEVACRWRLDWAALCIKMNRKEEARKILAEVLKLSRDTKTRTTVAGMLKKP